MNKKITILLPVFLVLAALALAACGSPSATEAPETGAGEGASPADTPVPAEPTEVPEEPTPEPVDVLPTAAPEEPALTANENVRVRSGPSQQYPVYAKMAGGDTAKLVGVSADGSYYAVEIPLVAPDTGWVDAEFAAVTGADDLPVIAAPPVPPTSDFVPVQEGEPTIIAEDAVFVSSGPGEQYPAYGIVEAGAEGLAIGVSEDGSYWVVRLDPEIVGPGHGWVLKEFVTTENVGDDLPAIKNPPVPNNAGLPSPDPNGPYGIAQDYLNVRSGPGMFYPVLAISAPGDAGEITGKNPDGEWWQVKTSTELTPAGLAWVHGAYIETFNVEDVPVVEVPAPPTTPDDQPPAAYNCLLTGQTPADETVFAFGETFEMNWAVQNVGEVEWPVDGTVISKVGAEVDQPLSEVTTLELANNVAPGDTFIVSVPMTAPEIAGQFGEYWIITFEEETVCYFYNVIRVEE